MEVNIINEKEKRKTTYKRTYDTYHSLNNIRKRYSLLLNLDLEDIRKLYNVALKLVGDRPTKEEMFEVVQELFKRGLNDYHIKCRTGIASYKKYKSFKNPGRIRYETLYKLYKYELALREETEQENIKQSFKSVVN